MIEFYLKLYDRQHNFKAEIYLHSNLQYTKTLNGVGSMSFNVPINYLKQNEIEITMSDHIELYKIENNSENIVWFGIIVNPTNSSINEMSIVCEGYYSCLFHRMQKHLYDHFSRTGVQDYLEETYTNVGYGELILSLLNTQNYYDFTGVYPGANKDYSSLKTTRKIAWDDYLDEKIDAFIEASGLCFEIDQDRKFNIYSDYGADKSEYYIIQDGNLINCSQSIIDYSNIINQVYVLNNFTEDVENENGETTQVDKYVTYIAENKSSIATYGLKQEILSVNDLREQETAKAYAINELNKLSQPSLAVTLECVINDELNIFDITPGDYIYINSDLLNIHQKIQVLEFTVDISTNKVNISLGNCLYRDSAVKQYRY